MDTPNFIELPWLSALLEAERRERDRMSRFSEYRLKAKEKIENRLENIASQYNAMNVNRKKVTLISKSDYQNLSDIVGLNSGENNNFTITIPLNDGTLTVGGDSGMKGKYRLDIQIKDTFDQLIAAEKRNSLTLMLINEEGQSLPLDSVIAGACGDFLFLKYLHVDAANAGIAN